MARRGPGEGSIYQRKSDGRWVGASAMKEAPVRVAADVLGHAQTRMTTDVYQRSSEAERRAATTAIEAAVLGEG